MRLKANGARQECGTSVVKAGKKLYHRTPLDFQDRRGERTRCIAGGAGGRVLRVPWIGHCHHARTPPKSCAPSCHDTQRNFAGVHTLVSVCAQCAAGEEKVRRPSPTAPTAKHCAVDVGPKLRMTTAQTKKGKAVTNEDKVSDREGCDAVQVEWGTHPRCFEGNWCSCRVHFQVGARNIVKRRCGGSTRTCGSGRCRREDSRCRRGAARQPEECRGPHQSRPIAALVTEVISFLPRRVRSGLDVAVVAAV